MLQRTLFENLEGGDLKRLVHNELHVDEYKSKMGEDFDICVISFKIGSKEAAGDLVSFIEKGYDFVLDADVSSGEKEDGDYLVFVELERTPQVPKQIMEIVNDILNLTEQSIDEWRFKYYKSKQDRALTEEELAKVVILTPKDYQQRFNKERNEMDSLKTAAGVKVTTTAPKNEFTEGLRIAAGLK